MKNDVYYNKGIIEVNFPDKCPYCGKDFAYHKINHIYKQCTFLYIFTQCVHCNLGIVSVHEPSDNKTIHTFPNYIYFDAPQEIKDLSPTACKVFQQALDAKASGLNYLVGAGIRTALEWLIWDYLTKMKGVPEEEVKSKRLNKRLEYLKEDQYKFICADIVRIFGNDEIHLFKDYNINIDEAINSLNALIANIYAEIIIRRANEKIHK